MNKSVSPVKILVVDDQPMIVEMVCEFLEDSGYRCVPCESSQEAVERFTGDTEVGLVLCDLHMPGLDGIELVRELQRLSGKHRAFEAIMLTGRADKQDVIRALREGFADYYQKPIDLNELLTGVRRLEQTLLERRRNFRDLGSLNQRLQYLVEGEVRTKLLGGQRQRVPARLLRAVGNVPGLHRAHTVLVEIPLQSTLFARQQGAGLFGQIAGAVHLARRLRQASQQHAGVIGHFGYPQHQ